MSFTLYLRIPHANVFSIALAAFFLQSFPLFTNPVLPYPLIRKLSTKDAVFKQYTQDLAENYKLIARGDPVRLSFYTYTASETDDLFSLAARCNIPYESIALLNQIPFADSKIAAKTLYLPSSPGLFIREKPFTPLEFILKTRYPETNSFLQYSLDGTVYTFVSAAKLTPTERAFFVDSSMAAPLEIGVISSSYGVRISPITGQKAFHSGTDIAAPEGTPVFACKTGIIAETGYDDRYGLYLILQHDNDTQSLYAHLSAVKHKKGAVVVRGAAIGAVGNTGLSTGPHLHFEIRVGGLTKDPSGLLKRFLK